MLCRREASRLYKKKRYHIWCLFFVGYILYFNESNKIYVMTKFKNKYRIEPARLEGYYYSMQGLYFITICTGGREHFFGEIINGEMHLSEIGKIAHEEWFKTLEIRKDMNLQLHEFVVMPNHIHGIIEIGDNDYNNGNRNRDDGRDAMLGVSHTEDNFDVTKNIGNDEGFVRDGEEKHRIFTKSDIVNRDNGKDAMCGVSHKDRNFDINKNVGNEDDVVRDGDVKHRVFTKNDIVNRNDSRDAMHGVSHTDDNFDVTKNIENEDDFVRCGDAKHRVFTKSDIVNLDNSRDAMRGVSHKDRNFDITNNVKNEDDYIRDGDAKHRVSTEGIENNPNTEYKNTFSSQSKNIASIMRGFKSSVTINARRVDDDFSWQTRFHDHVIRNVNSYLRISNYIITNPESWKEDRYF